MRATGSAGRLWKAWGAGTVEQLAVVMHLLRWIVLGAISGTLAGLASWVFLTSLDRVTAERLANPWLLYLLPLAGLVIGLVYTRWGGRATRGNTLLLDEIHTPTAWLPKRMAPLVLVGSVTSHLFGASVGREGAALQMSGSLSDVVARILRLNPADRRMLLMAAIAGGFGSVFGVPLAGAVFALEVQAVGRVRYEALLPALTASIVGDLVVGGLGHDHPLRIPLDIPVDTMLLAKVAVAGVLFGLVSTVFIAAVDLVNGAAIRWVGWVPARYFIGGAATVALAALVGRDYLGLSLPLIDSVLAGVDPGPTAFAWKLVFTAIALGAGLPGGEVTPLFVIGATLGGALAAPLGTPVAVMAAVGFVAVFAGATNTPLACTIMGAELFGSGAILPVAVGCVIAYVASSHRGVYASQRIDVSKGPAPVSGLPTAAEWRRTRRDRGGS